MTSSERLNELGFGSQVLVIGAARGGIGEAIAHELMQRGYGVLMPSVEALDVTHKAQFRKYIRNMPLPPRAAVYCAGVNHIQWTGTIGIADWDETFNINVRGYAWLIQELQRCANTPARVVGIASDAASRPMRASGAYCASKAAMIAFSAVAARELTPSGWAVNTVSPGKVADTPMTESVEAQVQEVRGWSPQQAAAYENISGTPLTRAVTKLEVAIVVADVLEMPAAVSGQDFVVNGGR